MEGARFWSKLAAFLFFPIALALVLPLVLVVAIGFYFAGAACTLWELVRGLWKRNEIESVIPKPHFMDMSQSSRIQSDK